MPPAHEQAEDSVTRPESAAGRKVGLRPGAPEGQSGATGAHPGSPATANLPVEQTKAHCAEPPESESGPRPEQVARRKCLRGRRLSVRASTPIAHEDGQFSNENVHQSASSAFVPVPEGRPRNHPRLTVIASAPPRPPPDPR
jgi:hypothetical protein